jgi:hypothetical protein
MKTITIQIGNTDNKLTQQEWAEYVNRTSATIDRFSEMTHFFGGSPNWYRWQNVAWVVEMSGHNLNPFKAEIERVRELYRQESVAVTIGETEFV